MELSEDRVRKALNLGCGGLTMPGAVNLDIADGPGVDAVWDLDRHPWPFDSGAFDEIHALDVLEHLQDFLGAMRELHRLLRPGGQLHVRTNYWRSESSYDDPTHRRHLTERSFDYWIPGTFYNGKYPQYAQGRHFRLLEHRLSGNEQVFELERLP